MVVKMGMLVTMSGSGSSGREDRGASRGRHDIEAGAACSNRSSCGVVTVRSACSGN